MEKTFFDYVGKNLASTLEAISLELLSMELREIPDKNTGEIQKSCRYTVLVPKGNRGLSRIKFSVKISEDKLRFDPEIIDIAEEL